MGELNLTDEDEKFMLSKSVSLSIYQDNDTDCILDGDVSVYLSKKNDEINELKQLNLDQFSQISELIEENAELRQDVKDFMNLLWKGEDKPPRIEVQLPDRQIILDGKLEATDSEWDCGGNSTDND